MATTPPVETPPSPGWFSRSWSYVFPELDCRTDRLVRRLILANLAFLLLATYLSDKAIVVFSAILAGNAVGAIGGLLFAIPKQAPVINVNQVSGGQQIAIHANTSLEEVSDWLTKTIIGAGLVSWRQILQQLDESGGILGTAVTRTDSAVSLAAGVAILVASSALGALIGYLWFARHWPSELAGAVKGSNDILGASGQKQATEPVAPAVPNLPPPPPPGTGGLLPPPPGMGFAPDAAIEDAAAGGEEAPTEANGEELVDVAKRDESITENSNRLREAVLLKYAQMRSAPLFSHDWAKGMFRGSSSVTSEKFGARNLTASVRTLGPDWFEVNLEVSASPRPETEAIFFLHNTFAQPTPTVGFDPTGVARLTVTAYGAFTVGVMLDDGTTELELDLAQLEGAPKNFLSR